MKKAFYSDLDNTLVYAGHKMGVSNLEIVPVETYSNGGHGYMSKREIELISTIIEDNLFIPVTTRSIDQAKRVDVFNQSQYAICSNGGTILIEGEIDETYKDSIFSRIKELGLDLDIERASVERKYGQDLEINRIVDDCFLFIKAKDHVDMNIMLNEIIRSYKNTHYKVFNIGRKVYIIPFFISKEKAISYLNNKLGVTLCVGAGDSEMDRGFLKKVDYPIVPKHNSLFNNPYKSTETVGILASEEILEYVIKVFEK
mgnify:CR=1 FL=1